MGAATVQINEKGPVAMITALRQCLIATGHYSIKKAHGDASVTMKFISIGLLTSNRESNGPVVRVSRTSYSSHLLCVFDWFSVRNILPECKATEGAGATLHSRFFMSLRGYFQSNNGNSNEQKKARADHH